MHRQPRRGAAVVTESVAQVALRRGATGTLAPGEERVLRMRLGAGLPGPTVLERITTATDEQLDLLAIEIETYLRLTERGLAPGMRRVVPAPAVTTVAPASRTKEKIIRALRKKV
jgi:hypothetical protein